MYILLWYRWLEIYNRNVFTSKKRFPRSSRYIPISICATYCFHHFILAYCVCICIVYNITRLSNNIKHWTTGRMYYYVCSVYLLCIIFFRFIFCLLLIFWCFIIILILIYVPIYKFGKLLFSFVTRYILYI